ncbi:MAG: putative membrane protein [Planctomycetota bacterium]|jgi:putative membrane protein
MYLYIKALHVIFVVTWFSGLFYLARLFVYNREAQDKEGLEKEILTKQFSVMIKRLLFGIAWPSAIITFLFGISLLYLYKDLPLWLMLKLGFVLSLFLYQFSLHYIYIKQASGVFNQTSTQLRLWNEVPTIILFAIVFLVVVKQGISIIYGLFSLILLIVVIMSAVKIYKLYRKR